MAKLSDIIAIIEDNVKVQYLSESCLGVKDKKRTKDTEITFVTCEVDANFWVSGDKTALIVWVDKNEFNRAIKALG